MRIQGEPLEVIGNLSGSVNPTSFRTIYPSSDREGGRTEVHDFSTLQNFDRNSFLRRSTFIRFWTA